MGKCLGQPEKKQNGGPAASLQPGNYKQITKKYHIDPEVLGKGNFGKVFRAHLSANKDIKFAIKTLPKNKIGQNIELIRDEIKILQSLDHPSIIKYHETYESPKYMYLVMEFCGGGELFERITKSKDEKFGEHQAAVIMRKLFHAINHCHANSVAHRDLKPENIMYVGPEDDSEIKIIDFGLSKKKSNKAATLDTVVGTPYYVAPEVLKGQYGQECDLWSLGVIMYILLSGCLPFSGNHAAEVFEKVKGANYTFQTKEWTGVSEEAKDLIRKLLTVDIRKRLTATQALQHNWFSILSSDNKLKTQKSSLNPEVISQLKEYQGISKLKKEAMNVMIKMLKEDELSDLREQFKVIDKDNTGMINVNELEEALKSSGHPSTATEIHKIMQNVDYMGNGKINYTEFLAATVSVKSVLTNEMLWALFKHFDTDDSDFITPENIQEAMSKVGKAISSSEIDHIMKEHDLAKNGKITFDEFKVMMHGLDVVAADAEF